MSMFRFRTVLRTCICERTCSVCGCACVCICIHVCIHVCMCRYMLSHGQQVCGFSSPLPFNSRSTNCCMSYNRRGTLTQPKRPCEDSLYSVHAEVPQKQLPQHRHLASWSSNKCQASLQRVQGTNLRCRVGGRGLMSSSLTAGCSLHVCYWHIDLGHCIILEAVHCMPLHIGLQAEAQLW